MHERQTQPGPVSHQDVLLVLLFFFLLCCSWTGFVSRKTQTHLLRTCSQSHSTEARLVMSQCFKGCCPARVQQSGRLAGEDRGLLSWSQTDFKVSLRAQTERSQAEKDWGDTCNDLFSLCGRVLRLNSKIKSLWHTAEEPASDNWYVNTCCSCSVFTRSHLNVSWLRCSALFKSCCQSTRCLCEPSATPRLSSGGDYEADCNPLF